MNGSAELVADVWFSPDEEVVPPQGNFPDDLVGVTAELALKRLYRRLGDPKQCAEISTPTLARIVKDLGTLRLQQDEPEQRALERRRDRTLELVKGLPVERRLEVLQRALDEGADDADSIRAAIKELEAGNGAGT